MEIIIPVLIILVFAKIFGEIFVRMKQPPLIGELMAGIILGPSILGIISPDIQGLDILAELGIFFLVFFAGMHMMFSHLKEDFRTSIFVALMGTGFAIVSGIAVGTIFNLGFISTLFLSVVFALAALPIGVRILLDMGKMDTPTGRLIITSAVIDDIFSFIFLAIVLSIAQGTSHTPDLILLAILKIAIFLLIVYIINRFLKSNGGLPKYKIKSFMSSVTRESQFFAVLASAILIAYLGAFFGITFIIGIFYAGIVIKKSSIGEEAYSNVYAVISSISSGIFSPIFFVYLGLHMDLTSVFDLSDPLSAENKKNALFLLVSILFAIVGKSGGAFLGGILANLRSKEALAVSLGLNARGLMGLVIAGIGLQYGLIDTGIYTMLVVMCMITTFMTPYGLKKVLK